MNPPLDTRNLQLKAMREALDRAARTAASAEDRAAHALHDFQVERGRNRQMAIALDEATQRLEFVTEENKRLRRLIGGLSVEQHAMTAELRSILDAVRKTPVQAVRERAAA